MQVTWTKKNNHFFFATSGMLKPHPNQLTGSLFQINTQFFCCSSFLFVIKPHIGRDGLWKYCESRLDRILSITRYRANKRNKRFCSGYTVVPYIWGIHIGKIYSLPLSVCILIIVTLEKNNNSRRWTLIEKSQSSRNSVEAAIIMYDRQKGPFDRERKFQFFCLSTSLFVLENTRTHL